MIVPFNEFKEKISRHAETLRKHKLLDPADRVEKGYIKRTKTLSKEAPVKVELLDEIFSE